MNTDNNKDSKYAVMLGLFLVFIVFYNAIVERNIIDIIYLALLIFCAIRYIIVCRNS